MTISGLFLVDKDDGWVDIVANGFLSSTSGEGKDALRKVMRSWTKEPRWLVDATGPGWLKKYLLPLEFLNLTREGKEQDES